jgi:hypothetical protein
MEVRRVGTGTNDRRIPIKTVPLPPDLHIGQVPLLYAVGEMTEWNQYRDRSRPGGRDFCWPIVQASAASYAQYLGPKEQAYWVFDRQMAKAISEVAGDRIVRKHQSLAIACISWRYHAAANSRLK